MIFVTVGTQLPFDRLLQGVDLWAKDHPEIDIFGQTSDLSAENYLPQHFPCAARLAPAEFDRRVAEARLIIAHAGTGSLIGAMSTSKPILVMPRRAEFREHRNDHQLATVDRFGNRPGVYVAYTPQEVGPMIDQVLAHDAVLPALSPFAEDRLLEALRDLIFTSQKT